MDEPPPITQLEPKPSVVPMETSLNFPCTGTDEDCIKLTLNNPSMQRITYKIIGTKLGFFKVVPSRWGFVNSKDNVEIELQPKPLANSDGWNKYDNFKVFMASAPKGNLWVAEEIWENRGGPTNTKVFEVKLKAIRYSKPEPEPPPPPKPKKKAPLKKTPPPLNMKAAIAGEPYVEPMIITVKVPPKGTDDEAVILTFNNTTDNRLTWRIKGSKMQLFRVEPKCGFAEPHTREEIEVIPTKKITPASLVFEDHFMIITAKAPSGGIWTADQLWEGKSSFKLTQADSLKVKIKAKC